MQGAEGVSMKNANVTAYETTIYVTAPTAYEAFDAALSAIAEAGGDWEVSKPYDVGVCNGAIATGKGITARRK